MRNITFSTNVMNYFVYNTTIGLPVTILKVHKIYQYINLLP